MSTTTGAVYTAMHAVMNEVEGVAKRDKNSHQGFNFRGIDATINALGPAFRKHGLIVTPNVKNVEHTDIRTAGGKPSTRCVVIVDYIFYAASDGSSIVTTVVGEAFDSGDKATPKAMSVAFRTALLQAFILPTDEPDPDSHTYEREAIPMMTGAQQKALGAGLKAMKLLGDDVAADRLALFKEATGREATGGDLTEEEADKILSLLKARKELADSLGAEEVK